MCLFCLLLYFWSFLVFCFFSLSSAACGCVFSASLWLVVALLLLPPTAACAFWCSLCLPVLALVAVLSLPPYGCLWLCCLCLPMAACAVAASVCLNMSGCGCALSAPRVLALGSLSPASSALSIYSVLLVPPVCFWLGVCSVTLSARATTITI